MSSAVYSLLIAAAVCLVLICHILSNRVLTKRERFWFTVVSGIFCMCELLEVAVNSSALAAARPTLFCFMLLFELGINPMISPFRCFAYGRKKLGYIALAVCGAYDIFLIAAFFFGALFGVDAAGNYWEGPCMLGVTIFALAYTLFDQIVLYSIGKQFHEKDRVTLVALWITVVLMFVLSYSCESSSGTLSSGALCMTLMYIYYYGLKQKALGIKLQDTTLEAIQAVVNAIDAKDEYTKGHSRRVAEYSRILASHLGYKGEKLSRLYYAASLHDVGKIGIPDGVLNKAGRLDDIEFVMMKEHALRGSDIAKQISLLPEAYPASRHHHERYDGRGYPDGLAGNDIPEIARIIAVADTYDAMNSDRIYRKALPRDVIRSEMEKGSGTQFDPAFVKVFIELMDSGELDNVVDAGRADMVPPPQEDNFTKLSRDILEFFLLKHDYTGEWDEEFDKWDKLKEYMEKVTDQYHVGFELVVVSIKPADDRTVTDEHQEKAISVMQATAEKMMSDGNVCSRISLHQLALIFRKDDSKDLSTTMKDILIYFYKIFESEPFSIGYYIIKQ